MIFDDFWLSVNVIFQLLKPLANTIENIVFFNAYRKFNNCFKRSLDTTDFSLLS